VYCGEMADTKDHLIPRGYSGDADRLRVPTVPSCVECNSTLNDIYLPDVMERREVVRQRYRIKYRRLLKIVWYGEQDLLEFGPQLRSVIMSRMEQHISIMRRLSWPTNPTYDADAWGGAWEEDAFVDENKIPMALRGFIFDSKGTL